jgi:CTP synthase
MVPRFESSGLTFTGKDETGQRMEIIELPNHPFYVGAQFHPEYKSRPGKPSPLFLGEEKHKNNAKALGFFLRVSTYLN